MLTSIVKRISLDKDLQQEINNFFLLNQDKEFINTQLLYIPPIIFPIPENDPIKKERGLENATYTETRGYYLFIAYFESDI